MNPTKSNRRPIAVLNLPKVVAAIITLAQSIVKHWRFDTSGKAAGKQGAGRSLDGG